LALRRHWLAYITPLVLSLDNIGWSFVIITLRHISLLGWPLALLRIIATLLAAATLAINTLHTTLFGHIGALRLVIYVIITRYVIGIVAIVWLASLAAIALLPTVINHAIAVTYCHN